MGRRKRRDENGKERTIGVKKKKGNEMRLWGHGGRGARRWVDGAEGDREKEVVERGEKGQNKDERIEGGGVEEGKREREKRNKD